jgi:soluble lytic murein transglycosylase-like protein
MNNIQRFKLLALSTCVALISACSSVPTDIKPETVKIQEPLKQGQQQVTIKSPVVKEITQHEHDVLVAVSQDQYHQFLKKNGHAISVRAKKSYNKGYSYKNYIETIAAKNKLDVEIYALPAIESDYNPSVISSNNAGGMWQMMPAFGKTMGLVVNKKVDERKNWKKSTDTALKYLGKSKAKFKSDELAVLSYYTGAYKIQKAIKKNNTHNIWVLLQDEDMFGKAERDYIFKYMAYAEQYKKLNDTDSKIATK